MPTVTVTVTALGSYTSGTAVGGTNLTSVTSDDGDTSYREMQSGAATWTCTDLVSTVGPILRVTPRLKIRKTAGAFDAVIRVRENSVDADSAALGVTSSYVLYQRDFALAPDGSHWTMAKVNGMEIGYATTVSGGTERMRLTFLDAVVTYSLEGGFVFVLLELLGPVFGAAVLLREVAAASQLLARRHGIILDRDEISAAWRALRTHPRPAFVLPSPA